MTHPIAKAIAERIQDMRSRGPGHGSVDGDFEYAASLFERGDFDDLLEASHPPSSWWRMVAVMRERLRAGESVGSVADDYRTPEDVVAMLVDAPTERPVMSEECIDELLSAHIAAGEPKSVVEQYEERAVTKRKPEYAAKCARVAAELRAWEAWRAKKEEE